MPSVALITDQKTAGLTPDDQALLPHFKKRGADVHAECWDSKHTAWKDYDLCILRSTWDYHFRYQEFLSWLDDLQSRNVNLWNSVHTVKWNGNKSYLSMLKAKGVPIVPTFTVNQGVRANLGAILNDKDWDDVVLKPTVSAAANRTYRVKRSNSDKHQTEFESIVQESGALIQPYLKEIETTGEYSFMFFGGDYSHAVLKKPSAGDFRSQELHGGTSESTAPEAWMIEEAAKVLRAVEEDLLYARVDMIRTGDHMLLVELELTEPSLFFEFGPGSPERFANEAMKRM